MPTTRNVRSYYKLNLNHLTALQHTAHDGRTHGSGLSCSVGARRDGPDDRRRHERPLQDDHVLGLEGVGPSDGCDPLPPLLEQYRTRIDTGQVVNNEKYCGKIHPGLSKVQECVPNDQQEILPSKVCGGANAIIVPGTSGKRARCPIAVGYRAPTDFLWQRAPTQLNGWEDNPRRQFPGIDYLLPYWMIRYYTEVTAPPSTPIPSHPGPAYA